MLANSRCQSCKKNAIGFDLNLVEQSTIENKIVTAKCLDCNHLLCFTCYLSHEHMRFFKDHQVIFTELNSPLISFKPKDHESMKLNQDDFSSLNRESIADIESFYIKIKSQINETFDFCENVLLQKKDSMLKDLNFAFSSQLEFADCFVENIEFISNYLMIDKSVKENCGSIIHPFKSPEVDSPQSDSSQTKAFQCEKIEQIPRNLCLKFRIRLEFKQQIGGTGLENNRFTEPNGLTVDKDKNIIVADSNSNFMKVFDARGEFRFKFGIDKLLFPNKVVCHKETGNIIITERKPAHEVKIFNRNGEFIRRFGSGMLKSPRGVCIDRNSQIVVLESKVMRVLIFSMEGLLIKFFDVSKYFKFANSICTSQYENRIFISDNHSHDIKVFNYDGELLKVMGGPGLTNYPTSVDTNSKNQILVTDNYNSFNLTILSESGELVSAYTSKQKHARILDVCLIDDETIMFASKDNRITMYKY